MKTAMPGTTIQSYRESDKSVLLPEWLDEQVMKKTKRTADAVRILRQRYTGKSREREESLQRERENIGIAEQVYNLRMQANLSQRELADLVGTTQSAISRLEDADYDGHSLTMLRRIAAALNQHVEVRFVPNDSQYTHA